MTTTYTTKAAGLLLASLPEEDWRNGKLKKLLLIVNLDDEDTLTLTREEADGVIYPDTNIDLVEYEDGILDRDDSIDLMHYLDKNNMLE
jgi:hypothetical protein